MSQTAVFVTINRALHDEVLSHTPDFDDLVQCVKDFGYEEIREDQYVLVEWERYEIGDGESGADYDLVAEDILLAMYEAGELEEMLDDLYGLESEMIYSGSEGIMHDDLLDE